MATIGPSTLTYLYGGVSVCAHRLNPAGNDTYLATRLVGIPNRHRERPATVFSDADDSHVKIGDKALAFLLRHRRRQTTLPLSRPTFRGLEIRSFDHLVRPHQERLRDRQADGLGCFEVNDEVKLRGLFHREISRLRAFENLVDVGGGPLP